MSTTGNALLRETGNLLKVLKWKSLSHGYKIVIDLKKKNVVYQFKLSENKMFVTSIELNIFNYVFLLKMNFLFIIDVSLTLIN